MILRKSIVLVGMMGSGKTAVGNALSKILAIEHVDSDEEIVKAANWKDCLRRFRASKRVC